VILLDTNVVSALMQRDADAVVARWLDGLATESVWLPAIVVFELRFGTESLAQGRRRRQLEEALDFVLRVDFADRILPFDERAAAAAATIAAKRRRAGKPTDLRDTLIAGIVVSQKAQLATRNRRHFDDLEIDLIDPWAA
jgi:predicted nucleic acid-binding protein